MIFDLDLRAGDFYLAPADAMIRGRGIPGQWRLLRLGTRRWQGIQRGARRDMHDVAGHVSMLLMNVTVEDRGGFERREKFNDLCPVACEPIPIRLQVPERPVREDDNRLGAVERLQIAGEPGELVFSHHSLRVRHVIQCHKMDALVVEALVRNAKVLLESGTLVRRGIMLARQEDRAQPRQWLDKLLELSHALATLGSVIGLMGQVSGEHHEVRCLAE